MFTSMITNVVHPTLVDQTDRDPHRKQDEDAARRHQHARPHPHVEAPAAEVPAADHDHQTIGLLIDVRA